MVASRAGISLCYHCGDTCKSIVFFDHKPFCCEGCKTVYEVLQNHDLAAFYDFERDGSATQAKVKGLAEFAWLQHPEVSLQLIHYQSECLNKVSFKAPSIHCSSCIWLLEHLYKIHTGVLRSEVDFVKKEIYIDYDPRQLNLQELVYLLSKIGYEPQITLADVYLPQKKRQVHRHMWYKMGVAGFAFGNIMLLSLPAYFGLDVHGADHDLDLLFKGLNIVLSIPVLVYAASEFIISAFRALRHGQVNLEVPLCLGMLALYGNSLFEIFSGIGPGYLDSFTALVFFLLAGRALQQQLLDRMRFEKDHSAYFPLSVLKIEDGKELHVPITKLSIGDHVLVRYQELIPADGVLVAGEALIDYSFVTGEAVPVSKKAQEVLSAGGRQMGGAIEVILTKAPSQSYLMQLWDQNEKENLGKDDFASVVNVRSKYFTFAVLLVAFMALLYWTWAESFSKGIWVMTTTLNVCCPCALAVSIPFTYASVMRHLGRKQFFLRNPQVIERIASLDTIVFDKTGTLTADASQISYQGVVLSREALQVIKAGLRQSVHPLSKQLYHFIGYECSEMIQCEEFVGKGLRLVDKSGSVYKLGSSSFVNGGEVVNTDTKPSVWIAIDGQCKGRFVFDAQYLAGLPRLMATLRKAGYGLSLLSGDNDASRKPLQELLGEQATLKFQQKPEDKAKYIQRLQAHGHKVMMVGDGLNDALALRQSHVGAAVVQHHSQFFQVSDVLIGTEAVPQLDRFIRYCKSSMGVVKASFVYASLYNMLGLTFAVQGLFTPVFAAILMPVSSVMVVLFALALTRWRAQQILK